MQFDQFKRNNVKFQQEIDQATKGHYLSLAHSQKPLAMLITCVDSRIMPEQLLGLNAGEIFCLRNIASLVPKDDPATTSAIEYAVCHLNIRNIVVLGHSNCGGINALTKNSSSNHIKMWLDPWHDSVKKWLTMPHSDEQHHCQEQAVLESIKNIKNMQFISENVNLHAWHLDIASAKISELNPETNKFV